MDGASLKPANGLAANGIRFPNESEEYRRARTALLAAEIELRRRIERVAEQARALPPGGEVPEAYRLRGGPARSDSPNCSADTRRWSPATGCSVPSASGRVRMGTSLLSAWDGEVRDIEQRVAIAVIPTSPIERLKAFERERGWHRLRLHSSQGNYFNRDYGGETPENDDVPAFNVFARRDGTIRHF